MDCINFSRDGAIIVGNFGWDFKITPINLGSFPIVVNFVRVVQFHIVVFSLLHVDLVADNFVQLKCYMGFIPCLWVGPDYGSLVGTHFNTAIHAAQEQGEFELAEPFEPVSSWTRCFKVALINIKKSISCHMTSSLQLSLNALNRRGRSDTSNITPHIFYFPIPVAVRVSGKVPAWPSNIPHLLSRCSVS